MQERKPTPAKILRIALWLFFFSVVLQSFGILFSLPTPNEDSIAYVEDGSVRVEGTVVRAEQSTSQRFTLHDLEVDGAEVSGKILVSAPLFPEIFVGDRLRFRCSLQTPETFDGFQYDQFLAGKGIYKTCFLRESPLLISQKNLVFPFQQIADIRSSLMGVIEEIYGEPHGALVAGLLFGDTSFSQEWNDRFSQTGTSHIVAASGYNIALVTFLLFGLLTYLGVRRQEAFWVLLTGIAAYVLFAGAEAAVVRAGLMGAIILLSRQLGRKARMDTVLLLTVSIMLLINPYLLRYDVGFQLSIASTVALIYFAPILERKLRFLPTKYLIRESATATMAATLFSLPIIILSFGEVSVVGLIANILILPIIPYAMAFAAAAILIGIVSRPLGILVSGVSWVLLSVILFIIQALSETVFATILIPQELRIIVAIAVSIPLFLLWRSGSKNN